MLRAGWPQIPLILLFIFLIGGSESSFAQEAQTEKMTESPFIDQRDSLFYQFGFLAKDQSSSLCGPVSFENWQILEGRRSKADVESGVQNIINASIEFYQQSSVDVRNGLPDFELARYANFYAKLFGFKKSYANADLRKLNPEQIKDLFLDSRPQILLLRFKEIVQSRQFPHPTRGGRSIANPLIPQQGPVPPGEDNAFEIYHFVLQVYWDAQREDLWIMDPENSRTYTILKLRASIESFGPQTSIYGRDGGEFPRFRFGRPMEWSLVSRVFEKP